MQMAFISKDTFLKQHDFTLLRRGRDSLGVYNIYINKYFKVKDYLHGNVYLYIRDLVGDYRSIKYVKELPSQFADFWHWDKYVRDNTNDTL